MQDTVFAGYIGAEAPTPAQAAKHFGVSVRTVRTYAAQANQAMTGFASIELERGSGYRLHIVDAERYQAWVAGAAACEAVPQTPGQRVSYLLNDLLMRVDWITLDALAGILFVSRSAVSNDLKQVEKILADFGLTLEKRPHYGIRVAGSEMARRLCLANIIMESEAEGAPAVDEAVASLLAGEQAGGGLLSTARC